MPDTDVCIGCCCVGILIVVCLGAFIPDNDDTSLELNNTTNNTVLENSTLEDGENNTTLNNSSVNTTNMNNNTTAKNSTQNNSTSRNTSNTSLAKGSEEANDVVQQETGYTEEDIEYMAEYYESNNRRRGDFFRW